jgi:microcystin-dependent protein
MSNPYVGEIRMAGFNFAPAGWSMTSGQLVAISQNETLYNLIGTTYGGDGQSTFALPDLRSRMPMHMGSGTLLSTRFIATPGGAETATFPAALIPSSPVAPIQALSYPGSQAPSVSPFLVVNFIISLFGVFPSQT